MSWLRNGVSLFPDARRPIRIRHSAMTAHRHDSPAIVAEWVKALEARHLSELRVSELTRALRALSTAYVDRGTNGVKNALEGAGKRAAFALFYAPLHFLATYFIVQALEADAAPPRAILDIGCGTGAAGAAWAIAGGGTAAVTGIDRHPWAVAEAGWTYRALHINGRARQGDLARLPPLSPGTAVVAAYVLNELPDPLREHVHTRLVDAVRGGARLLIIEPISRKVTPWWAGVAAHIAKAGGRAEEWRFAVDLPEPLPLLDRAAGLDHRAITARSLYCPGQVG